MKRILLLLTIVLSAGMLLFAQYGGDNNSKDTDTSMSKGQPMSGWICNSKCVKPSAERATCDQSCTDKSGEAVFVGDGGHVLKIAESSQPMVKEHMGHHMKVMATMDEQQQELERIHFLNEEAP